jgi:inorganic pyrophosphatase
MVPGKDINIRVDHVYGREEALRVIEAARADYETHYGELQRSTD